MSDRTPLSIYSLYIINKAGGLIFQKEFAASANKLTTNDYLRLASTFHSLHAITAKGIHIAPVVGPPGEASRKPVAPIVATSVAASTATGGSGSGSASSSAASNPWSQGDTLPPVASGITSLESKSFRLQCFQSLTGIKFLLIASPNFGSHALEKVLQAIYLVYTDHVLKNPFYELEMPIRLEQFDAHLLRVIQQATPGGGGGRDGRDGGGGSGTNTTEGRKEKKEREKLEAQEREDRRDK